MASRVGAPLTDAVPAAAQIHLSSPAVIDFDSSDPTHNVMLSGWLIFLAMIFDALDGHVARLSRTSSQFGAELDSLCDLVSFGVAPGFLLVKMCPWFAAHHKEAIWVIAAAIPVCSALRLARFNVETPQDNDHLHFKGLPSPAAAGSIAGFAILFYTIRSESNFLPNFAAIDAVMELWLCAFALCVAALMVSRVPYPHVVNQLFRGRRSFGHIVGVVFALVAIMVIQGFAIPLLTTGFVLGPPAMFAIKRFWRRDEQPAQEAEGIF